MQRVLIAALAIALLVVGAYGMQEFHGDEYQSQSAATKYKQLWSAISSDSTSQDWPSVFALTEIFLESMITTFDTVADDMPKQMLNLQTRPKLIHSVGAVAGCRFVANSTSPLSYSGLLSGFNFGFIRFSLAAKPDPSADRPIAPGIGLKVLRDGIKSANLVSMYNLAGQESSWNFFEHDLTNHVPNLDLDVANAAQKQLLSHFKTASEWPTMVALSDWAQYNQSGVAQDNVTFPFRLVWHPRAEIRSMFSSTDQRPLSEVLAKLPIGPIYDVYAEDQPGDKPVLIGTLSTTTSPTSSLFGDKTMFLQHQRMDDDLELNPQWVGPASKILDYQASIPYYSFPDLPW